MNDDLNKPGTLLNERDVDWRLSRSALPYLQYITAALADGKPLESFPGASLEARVAEACDHFAEDNVLPRCWRAIGAPLPKLSNRYERWSELSEQFFYMAKQYFTHPGITQTDVARRHQRSKAAFAQRLRHFLRRWNHRHGHYVSIEDLRYGQYAVYYARLEALDVEGDAVIETVHYASAHDMYLGVEEYLKGFDAHFSVPMQIELTPEGREIETIRETRAQLSALEAQQEAREKHLQHCQKVFNECPSLHEQDSYMGMLLVHQTPFTHLMLISGLTRGDLTRRFHSAMDRWNTRAKEENQYWIKRVGQTLSPSYLIHRGDEAIRYGYNYESLIATFARLRSFYLAAGKDVDEYFRD